MKKGIDITSKKILISGGTGFLGSHLVALMKANGARNVFFPSSSDFDFRRKEHCREAVKGIDIVIHLAAKVGGIGFNEQHAAEMFYDNILMGVHLMHESWAAGVKKFVAIGTICCYPKFTPVPFREESLWDGYPEETNAPYGLAKKMSLVQAQAYRKQFGFNAIFLLPVNLYGPGDNFDPTSSHVVPSLIHRLVEAKIKKKNTVVVWGTGRATREFLFVKDAAQAIYLATKHCDQEEPINIGAGFEISIRELVQKLKRITGYTGQIVWDTTKPNGQPRRMVATEKAYQKFGFRATTDFDTGLIQTVKWYEAHQLGR